MAVCVRLYPQCCKFEVQVDDPYLRGEYAPHLCLPMRLSELLTLVVNVVYCVYT
jgi:hypothetical protein